MHLRTLLTAAVLLSGPTIRASGSILSPIGVAGSLEAVAARAASRPAGPLIVRVDEISTSNREKRGGSTARLQKMDTGSWDQDTTAACLKALGPLGGHTSNPSGMAVCYNLPSYDTTTGVFQADLRLYHLSDPRDDWAGVQSQGVNVGLSYVGAAVSSGAVKRMAPSAKRDSGSRVEERQNNSAPQMLQTFNFVGQINKGLMSPNLTETEAQMLLTPNIVLSATNPQSQNISTTLSADEVHFVNGIFANQVTNTTSPTPTAAAAVAAKPSAAFVLPGTTLGIFPIGLIITSVWTALFITAVGYGTMRRYQFREHYRMRVKRGASAPKAI